MAYAPWHWWLGGAILIAPRSYFKQSCNSTPAEVIVFQEKPTREGRRSNTNIKAEMMIGEREPIVTRDDMDFSNDLRRKYALIKKAIYVDYND